MKAAFAMRRRWQLPHSMPMPVMSVREMRMIMRKRFMPMRMAMYEFHRLSVLVRVLVMQIVRVLVIVLYRLVLMGVRMGLAQVQPHA